MKTLKKFLSLLLVLSLAGCGSGATPTIQNSVPLHFKASIQGPLGPSYMVEMTDADTLQYFYHPFTFIGVTSGTQQTEIKVTSADWFKLRSALHTAGFMQWKKIYNGNPQILDGTNWSISIYYPDISLDSSGQNDYPDEAQYKDVLAAIQQLIGGRAFR